MQNPINMELADVEEGTKMSHSERMGDAYDILTNKLENLQDTIGSIHTEVEAQNNLIGDTSDEITDAKNVMDALTQKTKEYLGTSDNCQTCSAIVLCISFLILLVITVALFGAS